MIALSINNWNENKTNKLQRIDYIESLVQDLTNDTLQIVEYIIKNRAEIDSLRLSFKKMSQYNTEDFIKYGKFELKTTYSLHSNFNQSTFNMLIATGDIILFDKGTIRLLLELNGKQKSFLNVQTVN